MKKKIKTPNRLSWKDTIHMTLLFLFFGYFIIMCNQHPLLDKYGVTAIGYVSEETYTPGNSKVMDKSSLLNGYYFEVEGKTYVGNAHQKGLPTGIPLEIEYLPIYPSMNRPKRKH
jgi:hypothetical protein